MTFGTTDEAAAGQVIGMTDLEDRLRGHSGEDVRKAVLERLDALERHLVAEAKAGLPVAAFERNTRIGKAVLAARAVIVAFPATRTGKGE